MKIKYQTLSLLLLLGACGGGGSGKKSGFTNLNTAYRPELCANGDSRPEAVKNTEWSLLDPNTNRVNHAYQMGISENTLSVYVRCEDNGLEAVVSVPYEINGKDFVVLASDSTVTRNAEGQACEVSVYQTVMQFGRDGNNLYFCDKENGNLTYRKN